MKPKLLIIDDDLNSADELKLTRRDYYNYLIEFFDIEYLDDLSQLVERGRAERVSAVLLDFVLSNWGTDALSVLPHLDSRLPVRLISKHWAPNFEKLRQTLFSFGQVVSLFTWEDLSNGERRGLVSMWLTRAIDQAEGHGGRSLGENDSIRILHLSDLQFGPDAPTDFDSESALAASFIRRYWNAPPTFIAITGDIAERGLPSEYLSAMKWLKTFTSELDPEWVNDRFLVIPGNHDLALGLVGMHRR